MRVAVHEPRRHHVALGIDGAPRPLRDASDADDPAVLDRHVTPEAGTAAAVHHPTVSDYQIVHGDLPSLWESTPAASRPMSPDSDQASAGEVGVPFDRLSTCLST